MNKALVLSCIAFTTIGLDEAARAQTALEAFYFLIAGDFDNACGKGDFPIYPKCDISRTENEIIKEYTNSDGEVFSSIFRKKSNCEYEFDFTSLKDKIKTRFDFTGMTGFIYDVQTSRMIDDDNAKNRPNLYDRYHGVSGTLMGVKFSSSYNDTEIDQHDAADISVLITSDDMEDALKKYRAEMNFFKRNYCGLAALGPNN